MKITIRIILCVLLFAICSSAFSICCFAEDFKLSADVNVIPSNPIGEPKIDIPSMISSKVTQELVDSRYQIFTVTRPEAYRFDPSIYLIEYTVSTEYWNEVSETNYQGLTDALDASYPTVYIPLFGDVADSKNNVVPNRVIGHIKLYYNWLESDYAFGMALYNLASQDFRDKANVWFYENVSDYLDRSDTVAEQVFMIRHPNALSEGAEKIAVIKTENDTVILDISDSLHLTSEMNDPTVAYTIEEYRVRRLEVEKELYKTVDSWEDVPFGGSGSSNPNTSQNDAGKWVPYVIFGILAVGGVAFAWVQVRKKSQHP